MNIALLTAGVLMGLTTVAHVVGGGPEFMPSIRNSTLPAPVRAVMDIIWHGVTVTLAVCAAGLVWAAYSTNVPLVMAICAIMIGFAALFLWYGKRQLGSIWVQPQWTVFLLAPALALWGVSGALG